MRSLARARAFQGEALELRRNGTSSLGEYAHCTNQLNKFRGAIFLGFAAFFVLDKTMRVLSASADSSNSHGQSHGHSHNHIDGVSEAKSTVISTSTGNNELRSRKSPSDVTTTTPTPSQTHVPGTNPSLRLSAYLNLFGDFAHNITDGLAMAASFYSSPALGAVTTIATFCHEIPHEVRQQLIFLTDMVKS